LRGQHHAGTKNHSGNAVAGVIVVTLLILLAVVIFLAVR
jgi:hypothetical protein